jgi:hypothetical protein
MNIDDEYVYFREREKLMQMDTLALEKLVGELFEEVYTHHNPERKEYHRLAALALNSKKKKTTLVFHMKKLIIK